jgi:hypothetical protein
VGAEIDEGFEKLIETLVEHEKAVFEADFDQSKPRPWLNFSSQTMKTPIEEKDEEKLHDTFSRTDIEDKYVSASNDEEAKSNELALPKVQGDFLAGFERDKRMQWRGRIRIVAHALSRNAGNGDDKGMVKRRTLDYLSRIFLKAEDYQRDG